MNLNYLYLKACHGKGRKNFYK